MMSTEHSTLADQMTWEVAGWRIAALERDRKDLKRAKALITRLRVENKALKEARRGMRNRLTAAYDRLSLPAKKYGFIMAAHAAEVPFSHTDKLEARAALAKAKGE